MNLLAEYKDAKRDEQIARLRRVLALGAMAATGMRQRPDRRRVGCHPASGQFSSSSPLPISAMSTRSPAGGCRASSQGPRRGARIFASCGVRVHCSPSSPEGLRPRPAAAVDSRTVEACSGLL